MKKIIKIALIVSVFMLGLTGCKKGDEGYIENPQFEEQKIKLNNFMSILSRKTWLSSENCLISFGNPPLSTSTTFAQTTMGTLQTNCSSINTDNLFKSHSFNVNVKQSTSALYIVLYALQPSGGTEHIVYQVSYYDFDTIHLIRTGGSGIILI